MLPYYERKFPLSSIRDPENRKDGEFIKGWDFLQPAKGLRLYYKERNPTPLRGITYQFYCVTHDEEPDCNVWCKFHGVGDPRGLFYICWGDIQTLNDGFEHYPDPDRIILALQVLKKLEAKFIDKSGSTYRGKTQENT